MRRHHLVAVINTTTKVGGPVIPDPVVVQNPAAVGAAGTNTITVPIAASTQHNTLVALVTGETTATAVVANPGGVALTQRAHSLVNRMADIWVLEDNAGGFTSIVVTLAAIANGNCSVAEVANLNAASFDTSASSSGTGVIATNSVIPTTTKNIAFGCASSRGLYVSGPTNGFTGMTRSTDGINNIFPGYRINAPLAAESTGWTNDNGAFGWDTVIAVLKGLSGGGGPPADLQAAINALPVGGTLDITGGDYTGQYHITKAMTLKGNGIIRLPVGAVATQALNIQANNVTIDGVSFDGTGNTSAVGSAIWTIGCGSLVVKNCNIQHFMYSGVMLLGATSPTVQNNTIAHIAVGQPNGTNAYGIALSHNGAGPGCTSCTITGNNISDVPTWMSINAHACVGGTISNNISDGSRRAYFFVIDTGYVISGITLTGNHARNAPAFDPTAYLIGTTQNMTFTNNFMDASYPWPADGVHGADIWTNGVDDFNSLSTGLTATGMTLGA